MHEHRLGRALAAALLAAAVGACATQPPPASTAAPALRPGDVDPEAGFETPGPVPAREVLPPELLRGPYHEVEELAECDGFALLYRVRSPYGDFAARGEALLRTRIEEIGALARLDERSRSEEFARALAESAKSPFVATWRLVRHPVDTAAGIPRGAWQQLQRAAALARGERGEQEESALRAFIGFESRKRALARDLGVDPYSTNPVLQRELNRFAWIAYAGGLPSLVVPFRSAGDDAPGLGATSDEKVYYYTPEDLRRLHRIELAAMGVSPPVADAFVAHPWFSPRHQVVLVDSLVALDPVRDGEAFFRVAVDAQSPADALAYQRAAELLRAYHEREAPVERLLELDHLPAGRARDGTLVVPLVADRALWTGALARVAADAVRAEPGAPAPHARFLVSGTLSERARAELAARGIRVTEHALSDLGAGTP